MPTPARMIPATAAWVALLMLAGCGRAPEEVPVPSGVDLCKDAVGDGPMVGIAYDVGGRNDRGINDAAFDGLSEAVEDFHATCLEAEAADGEQESVRADRLRHFADNGANVIIAIGTRYARSVDTVAQSYPRIRFALIDAAAPKRTFTPNVAVLNFVPEQIGFLAGATAAVKTKTGIVGYVGAPSAEGLEPSEPYEAGFRAGVEAAKPDVQIVAKRLQLDTPAPGKPDGAKKTATKEFKNDGADVVFGSPGVSQRALTNAALASGDATWMVGVTADQYQSATDQQKPHVLASVIKRLDTVTYDYIKSVAKNRPLTGRHTYGLDDDAIAYVSTGKFLSRKQVATVNRLKRRVESGNIEVPDSIK